MKRIVLALVPALILAGCSTQNNQNQQISAAQPLAQPAAEAQTAQTQTSTSLAAVQTDQAQKITIGKPLQYDAEVTPTQNDAAGQTQTASNVQLTASEIQAQYIGANLKWHSQRTGNDGTMVFLPDNQLQWTSPNTTKGKGQWRMEGNNLCTYYPQHGKWKGLPWRCAPVVSNDGKMLHDKVSYWKA